MNYNIKGRDYVKERMPMIGLGTYQIRNEQTIFDILDAGLGAGYRFIDTAQIYRNEPSIGKALKELLPKYKLNREDIFITSKLSPANQGVADASKSILRSLANLGTEYLDLLIIHWPGANKHKVDSKENSRLRKESWQVMEELHEAGKLRAIGVSNYQIRHLEELLGHAKVLPALNQCEFHPHYHSMALVDYCNEKGIIFQAYSSLGSPDGREALFNDPAVKELAEKYEITIPAFLLAWALNQGISVLPRSSKPERVIDNFSSLDIIISPEDVKSLISEKANKKSCWDPETVL